MESKFEIIKNFMKTITIIKNKNILMQQYEKKWNVFCSVMDSKHMAHMKTRIPIMI